MACPLRACAASAAAGLPAPVDGATVNVHDASVIHDEVRAAAAGGFSGKLCIHPKQVEVVHNAFKPLTDEVDWAIRVVEAMGARGSSDGVVLVDGNMVDRPVLLRARRLLARAGNRLTSHLEAP